METSQPGPQLADRQLGTVSRGPLEDTARGRPPTKLETLEATTVSRVLRGAVHPVVTYATGTRVVKGEDVLSVQPLGVTTQPQSTLFMICDGHSGIEAASFVASNFLRLLNSKLPSKLPNFNQYKDIELFAETVRKAVCQTFFYIDNEWAMSGLHSGTTVTVALVTGWLITVANVGDSAAVLDTGCSILELTKNHRLHESREEQARLKQAHCQLAPLGFHLQGPAKAGEIGVGPLRLWPGGLCVARSVGDLDAGPEVLPLPNIRQVIMPVNGCRLIMASDGLWDVLSLSQACKSTRLKGTQEAAASLMTAVSRDLRTMDDTTVLVIDMLPVATSAWPSVVLGAGATAGGGPGLGKPSALMCCFRPDLNEPDSRDVHGPGHLMYYADVDTLKAYPNLKPMLSRTMIHHSQHVPVHGRDFTQHGAKPWRLGMGAAVNSPSPSSHHTTTALLEREMSKVMSSPNLHAQLGLLGSPSNSGIDGEDDNSVPGPESLYGAAAHGGTAAANALRLRRNDSGLCSLKEGSDTSDFLLCQGSGNLLGPAVQHRAGGTGAGEYRAGELHLLHQPTPPAVAVGKGASHHC